MLFMTTYSIRPEHRDAAIARFKETGGPPPDGVTQVGRWQDVGGNHGWTLAETDDLEALHRWTYQWSDVLTFEISPVLTDEQFVRTIS